MIGSHAALVPFKRYVPRDEPASFTSPDPATAANALVAGEIDWLEIPMPNLLPGARARTERGDRAARHVGVHQPATAEPCRAADRQREDRRAVLAAIDRRAVTQAVMSDDQDGATMPMGYLASGNPDVDLAGIEANTKGHSTAEVKAMLEDASYHGERLVLLHTTDQRQSAAAGQGRVVAVRQRHAGAQSIATSCWARCCAATARTRGSAGPPPRIEAAYNAWLDSDDPGEQTRLEREISLAAFDAVPFVPLGRYMPRAAWSTGISDPLNGRAPVFWNVSKG